MKKLMTLMLSLCLGSMLLAQNLVEKKDYYDLFETKIKTVWHEKGDGSKHGIENGFYENGELKYTHNWENGVWTSLKYYFQDGQTRIEAKRLSSGKFDGQQLFYLFENGQRYLKVKAIVATDVVKEYYFYEKPNILGWSLIFNDNTYIYKKYNSTGSEIANISIASGLVTGVIEQIDYENSKFILKDNNIVSFKDNERVTKEVSSGLILSEWNQNDLT